MVIGKPFMTDVVFKKIKYDQELNALAHMF